MAVDETFSITMPEPTPNGVGWFKARWPSQCAYCRQPIYEGDWARKHPDHDGAIFCRPCGEGE